MEGIRVTLDGRNLLFATTGEVAVENVAASPQVLGTWNANMPDNRILYTLEAVAQAPLEAIYEFNANNQLVAKVRRGQTTSEPFTFAGRLELDRNHDIVYVLVDRVNGEIRDVGPRFLLDVKETDGYSIEPKTNSLKVTLKDGTQTKIAGETPEEALETSANPDAAVDADDLLMYQAVTRNVVGGKPLNQRARLNFPGEWDINNGQLVFVAKVGNEGVKPAVSIGFTGRFKAITAGFMYFADKTAKTVSLSIRGQHAFKSDDSETHLDWETSIGFTGKTFRARVDVDLARTTAQGGMLDLKGTLTLAQTAGTPLQLDLSIQATYGFNERNVLVFTASISEGDRPAYDLMLTGSFVYSKLQMSFAIHYTSSPGASQLTAEVGLQGDRDSMIKMIAVVLDISQQQARLKVNLSFSVRLRFANGIRIKDEPVALPAPPVAAVAGAAS